MLYIKLFIEREKNIGQSAPECPFKETVRGELNGTTFNGILLSRTGVTSYGALGHIPPWSLHVYTDLAISIYV